MKKIFIITGIILGGIIVPMAIQSCDKDKERNQFINDCKQLDEIKAEWMKEDEMGEKQFGQPWSTEEKLQMMSPEGRERYNLLIKRIAEYELDHPNSP